MNQELIFQQIEQFSNIETNLKLKESVASKLVRSLLLKAKELKKEFSENSEDLIFHNLSQKALSAFYSNQDVDSVLESVSKRVFQSLSEAKKLAEEFKS
ncbi:hypothetical protein LFX25_20600 [Leptospira sp. FAT2]|uniref:hypothetical protein n=1 Tax=Leptospira sanjuanensis TaxID=2879643 RepID=UPI001EE82E10|nr:hypothetical protein [Leptospira sanjuanensis]MCG6195646.1 hypothetical protein [Leptospira sanjuanensis]